eukprot:1185568-Rhodomonas_salina.1
MSKAKAGMRAAQSIKVSGSLRRTHARCTAMSGTHLRYGGMVQVERSKSGLGKSMKNLVSTPIALRPYYAMSGSSTPLLCDVQYSHTASSIISSYASATRCPVLTYCIVLLGQGQVV